MWYQGFPETLSDVDTYFCKTLGSRSDRSENTIWYTQRIRKFCTRLKEHQRAVSNFNSSKSALVEHVCETSHNIAWDDSRTGIYVDDWKGARVIPIYKAEDKRKCEKYRPISIFPVVSKVFEREVFNQVYRYLSENSLLSRFQSEFRPKHSTLSALIQMCDDWLQNMDNGNLNCVVFLDVQKAFDSVNHEILLNKMHEYFGMSGTQLKWFK